MNLKRVMCYLLLGGSLAVLSSCGYKSVDQNNKLVNDLNDKYKKSKITTTDSNQYVKNYTDWYKVFNNAELNNIITVAVSKDFDVQTASLRLQSAAALMGEERSALMPSLDVKSTSKKSMANNKRVKDTSGDYNALGLSASYEVDLWGKNYAAYQSASTELKSTALKVETAKITLVSDILNAWVNLMTIREQRVIYQHQLDAANNLLAITKVKYNNGSAELSQVLNQETEVINAQNNIDNLNYQENDIIRSLNIMMGKDPLDTLVIKSNTLPIIQPLQSKDLNVQVLANRPDIEAAFYDMLASKWDVKVATLSRLPSIDLTLDGSTVYDNLGSIFDGWLLSLTGNITMPLFNAGKLKGQEDSKKFLAEASVVNYKSTVFNAVKEFQNALDKENTYFLSVDKLDTTKGLLVQVEEQSSNSYLNGQDTYETVITNLNNLYSTEDSLIQGKQKLLLNRIYLYRTMGIPVNIKEVNNEKK
ncbi:efflux transporter outer membrane subunit [Rickettsiales bacterium LUAb2]